MFLIVRPRRSVGIVTGGALFQFVGPYAPNSPDLEESEVTAARIDEGVRDAEQVGGLLQAERFLDGHQSHSPPSLSPAVK